MAFLQPENIPSRNDLPRRLQDVARCLRDFLPDDVTVWLERTPQGETAALHKEFGDPYDSDDENHAYLIVLDPSAGIAVLEAPARIRVRFTRRGSDVVRGRIRELTEQRLRVLRENLDSRSVRSLPVVNALAIPEASPDDLQRLRSDVPVLCREDFSEETLRPALQRIMDGRDHPLGQADEAAARAAVKPEIEIDGVQQQLMFAPPTSGDEEILRTLDRRQERTARHLGPGYRLIRGVAGSGKTLILTHRAAHIASHFPKWRILLVCYNKALSQALSQQVKQHRNVEVRTLDSLALKVLNMSGRSASSDAEPDFATRQREALELAHALDDSKRFDMVLVDEAQDLDSTGLDLAWAMLKTQKDHFVMALDSAQSIYRRQMSWNPPERTARGRTTILDMNYRNTQEVLDLAQQILEGVDQTPTDDRPDSLDVLVKPEEALRVGYPPTVLACADLLGEARAIANKVTVLRAQGVPANNIAVLIGSEELRSELMRLIPEAMDTKARQNRNILASAEGKVRVATLALLKGLEYEHVIVGGANHVWVRGGDAGKEGQQRRLLYVAMTRATATLTVTFSGDGLMSVISKAPKL